MPESVTDRPTKSHEYLFLLSKSHWVGAERPMAMRAVDAAWLAALIDGEGSICFQERENQATANHVGIRLSIVNTNTALLERVREIVGVGGESSPSPRFRNDGSSGRPIYTWQVTNAKAAAVIAAVRPYLIAKATQADLALAGHALNQKHTSRGSATTPSELAAKRRLASACSDINHGREVDLGWFRPPAPGRWVPNAYQYDADAIREPHQSDSFERTQRPGDGVGNGTGNHSDSIKVGPIGATAAGRNRRSVWTISTEPFPEAHFACVDDQTEALTPFGWRRHVDLADGDSIAMYDPDTDSCRFAAASFHRYPYDGELVAIEKRDSSQRLTPNHRCYVRRRSGWTGIVRADELKPGMEILTCAPLEMTTIDGVGERLAALLGWYTTEGSQRHDGYVSICQSDSANPEKVAEIRSLLVGVGADFHEGRRERGDSIEVNFGVRGEVGRFLHGCGKRLGLDAIRLPDGEASALFDAMVDGDGHRREDGRSCIIQKDRGTIDRMQMLALRLGYRAVVSERQQGDHSLYLTRGRWLTLRGTNGTHAPIGRDPYTGIVWCPSAPTGLWMARRRGRTFITGNTYPQALVRPCILAGTSEHGECSSCGAPWVREVEADGESVEQRLARQTKPPVNGFAPRSDGGLVQYAAGSLARPEARREFKGWRASCTCDAPTRPQTVLDPFVGSGTTALVARNHGRRAIGVDLSVEYLGIAARRLQQLSLLS